MGTLYPVLLRSTIDAHYTLDAFNASSPRATLVIGLSVWIPEPLLAIGYFTYVYRSFREKVQIKDTHHRAGGHAVRGKRWRAENLAGGGDRAPCVCSTHRRGGRART